MYYVRYALTNQDFESMVYEEYFIYDTVGMIGSVGGTFGNYLSDMHLKKHFLIHEFLKTFFHFRNVHRIFIYWNSSMDIFISQKIQPNYL